MNTTVKIEWDYPEEQQWLCPGNIETALSAYCPNTKFNVTKSPSTEVGQDELWEETIQKIEEHFFRGTKYIDTINELKSKFTLIKK